MPTYYNQDGRPPLNLDGVFGGPFLGLLVAAALYGVAGTQTFVYFRKSGATDRPLFRNMVATLSALNTVQLIMNIYNVYFWIITSYGNAVGVSTPSWANVVQFALGGLIDLTVRTFFARRVLILCGLYKRTTGFILSGTIVILALFTYAMMMTHVICIYLAERLPFSNQSCKHHVENMSWMVYTYDGASAATDVTVAAAMCTLLWSSRTGNKKTDSLLSTLMTFSFNSGLLTSVVALTGLVVYATDTLLLAYLGVNYVLCQLHLNSLLVSLNARDSLRESYNDPSTFGCINFSPATQPTGIRYTTPLRDVDESMPPDKSGNAVKLPSVSV